MTICISSTGKELNSLIDHRFGRCGYFLFLDDNSSLKKAEINPGVEAIRGAGVVAAQEVASKKVDILIVHNIGPNAFGLLFNSGVKIFLAPFNKTIKEVFLMWKNGELKQLEEPNIESHFGYGMNRRGR